MLLKEEIDDVLDGLEDSRIKDKKYLLRKKKREQEAKAKIEASNIAEKFLQENPNINIGFVIECLQKKLISTSTCCNKLGISPRSFLRLRKKYKIEPAYTLLYMNKEKSILPFHRKINNNKAKKN